jgi:hypothetical protein
MSHVLTITPGAVTTWAHDVFGKAVALATFANMASTLVVDGGGDILPTAVDWPVFDVAASAISYPFRYSDDEWTDFGALTAQYSDPGEIFRSRRTIAKVGERFHSQQPYRYAVATQAPERRGSRSACNIKAVRSRARTSQRNTRSRVGHVPRLCSVVCRSRAKTRLRCPARLRLPRRPKPPSPWFGRKGLDPRLAEAFVPGAGWITFDPTNRSVGGRDLIPVPVARDISLCTPVCGSFFGPSDSFLSMDVTVSVTA